MVLEKLLSSIFGPATAPPPAVPPAAVPGAQTLDPNVMSVLQQFGFEPQDPAEEKRRAIASALAKGSQALVTPDAGGYYPDFLEGLGRAATTGAVEYTGQREEQAELKRKNNMDILKQMFGLEKLDQTNEMRMAIESLRNEDRDARTQIMIDNLNERIRTNQYREGQGDTRLDQSGRRIDLLERRNDELGRHNKVMEGISGDNAEANAKRASEIEKHNRIMEDLYKTDRTHAAERIKLERERAADARRKTQDARDQFQKKWDAGYFKKSGKAAKDPNLEFQDAMKTAKDMISKDYNDRNFDDPYKSPEDRERDILDHEEFKRGVEEQLEIIRSSIGAKAVPKPDKKVNASAVDVSDLDLPPETAKRVVKRGKTKDGRNAVQLDDGTWLAP